MISRPADGIWKISLDSNVYILGETAIDAGNRCDHQELKSLLARVTDPVKITKVIFTHMHDDHVGNTDLFPNAKFYAGRREIECFRKDPIGTVLSDEIYNRIKGIKLHEAESRDGLEIIQTPGHTRGSICIWMPDKKILFSGDTVFDMGLGRTDLPTSEPEAMQESVTTLLKLNHKILCPGHDY